MDGFGTSVESTLGIADAPVLELRDRITTALRYTFSWAQAVGDVGGPLTIAAGYSDPIASIGFLARIHDMQTALRNLLDMLPPDDVFPGNDAVAAYDNASSAFAGLYRDLALSRATLPHPELLEQLGSLLDAAFDAPAAAAKTLAEEIAQLLARLLGGTAAALWSKLWPYLLVAGGAGLVYVFRAPLGRAIGKVAA